MKRIYVLMAEGCEEIETVTPIDILQRAGYLVEMVSCANKKEIIGSHGIQFICNKMLSDVMNLDVMPEAIILPGGMPGAKHLAENKDVRYLIEKQFNQGNIIAAICAAPAITLSYFGVLEGKKATCYPGMEKEALKDADITWLEDSVVVDGNIITSRGPGTAGAFAFAILEQLTNADTAIKLKQSMIY